MFKNWLEFWKGFFKLPESDNSNATLQLNTGKDKTGLGGPSLYYKKPKPKKEPKVTTAKPKKKVYIKKEVEGHQVFVEEQAAAKMSSKGIDVESTLTGAIKETKNKKSKTTVEGNAKNFYTEEDWKNNFLNDTKGKKGK